MNKNKEMWNDWLIDNCVNGVTSFGVDKNSHVPFQCAGHSCARCSKCLICVFSDKNSCHRARDQWLDEEYIEPCPFKTGDIVEVSDNGNNWYLRRFMQRLDDKNDTYFGWYRCFNDGQMLDDNWCHPTLWKYCRVPKPYKEESNGTED